MSDKHFCNTRLADMAGALATSYLISLLILFSFNHNNSFKTAVLTTSKLRRFQHQVKYHRTDRDLSITQQLSVVTTMKFTVTLSLVITVVLSR